MMLLSSGPARRSLLACLPSCRPLVPLRPPFSSHVAGRWTPAGYVQTPLTHTNKHSAQHKEQQHTGTPPPLWYSSVAAPESGEAGDRYFHWWPYYHWRGISDRRIGPGKDWGPPRCILISGAAGKWRESVQRTRRRGRLLEMIQRESIKELYHGPLCCHRRTRKRGRCEGSEDKGSCG